MRKKKAIDMCDLGANPLVENMLINATKVISSETLALDKADKVWIPETHLLDHGRKVSVFVGKEISELTLGLSDRALRLWTYIIHLLQPNTEYVRIVKSKAVKSGIKSTRRLNLAFDELIRYSFIAETACRGYYWINPCLIYSGNRTVNFPDKVAIKKVLEKKAS